MKHLDTVSSIIATPPRFGELICHLGYKDIDKQGKQVSFTSGEIYNIDVDYKANKVSVHCFDSTSTIDYVLDNDTFFVNWLPVPSSELEDPLYLMMSVSKSINTTVIKEKIKQLLILKQLKDA